MKLLEDSARPLGPSTPGRRDPASGFGVLDISQALLDATWDIPLADKGEPNDDGSTATTLDVDGPRLFGTIDWGDDAVDAYRVFLTRGQTVTFRFDSSQAGMTGVRLAVFRPGTGPLVNQQTGLPTATLRTTGTDSSHLRLSFSATTTGVYILGAVADDAGASGPYRISAVSY
jgi:hypothetical protein